MGSEAHPKRQREETHTEEDSKRHKSYNQLLSSILDDEEDEPTQDLSDIFTTFQQELSSSDDFPDFDPLPNPIQESNPCEEPTLIFPIASDYSSSSYSSQANTNVLNIQNEEDDDDKERVIRHLLEASDDELGIPRRVSDGGNFDEVETNGGDYSLSLCDGLWEIEDEAANYYTLSQSELFM